MGTDLEVVGPDVVLPGSDQAVHALAVLLLVAAGVALLAALARRWYRRRRGRPAKRPVGVAIVGTLALVGAVTTVVTRPPPFFVPELPALPRLAPEDSFYYRPAADLPVDRRSDAFIASQSGAGLLPGFGGEVYLGVVPGQPFNLVDEDTPTYEVDTGPASGSSYPGPYPIPDPAYIGSLPSYGIDNHFAAVDPDTGTVWELLSARRWFGRWYADVGARWEADRNEYPPWSTTAAGLPMLPGLITYAEVAAGSIDHVVGAAVPAASSGYRWPARASDGPNPDASALPMGAWLRLRDDVDTSGLGPQARVVAEALHTYGAVVGDTGGTFSLAGTPDRRWDDADLGTLRQLTIDDFEVLDVSGVQVSPDSMQARPAG